MRNWVLWRDLLDPIRDWYDGDDEDILEHAVADLIVERKARLRLAAEVKRLRTDLAGFVAGSQEEAFAGDEARAEVERLREALLALKNGDCWCDRYYDPMCGHQDRCNQAAEAAREKM